MPSDVSPVPPPGWEPPAWLADVGWHPRELAWLASALHDRVQRLQIDNRELRGLPPSTDTEDMTLPIEFHIQNPVHRERFLHEGDTLRAVPARLQNPAGADIGGAVILDAAGQPRALLTRASAWRLADEILAATGAAPHSPEHDHEETN